MNESSAAAKFPRQYDAHYIYTLPDSQLTVRRSSNGRGLYREEVDLMGNTTVEITNYISKEVYKLQMMHHFGRKSVLSAPYSDETDPVFLSTVRTKALGEKTIKGFLCEGYSYESASSKCEMWVEKSAHFIVKNVITSADGISDLELVRASLEEPPAELFVVPAGMKML